ncbi:MAG: glycosyltransferase family 4 protein, partial [Bacteroidales bacterium]|nr:glycosyltransferase family 4 protein [Bacteroidales bacterium]
FRIPVVHTYHTMYEDYTHYIAKTRINKRIAAKLSKVGSKLYLNQCASVIAPSEKTKKALINYGVTNYIEIIPTGIKLEKFKKGLFTEEQIQNKREELGIKPEEKIILSLGRVAEEKSIDVIIKQMPSIVSSNPQIKLLIVGDGPEKTNLEALSKQIGMERNICFTGKVPWNDTVLYYQMADLFISASKTETQGLTILESMAAGTPVIVRHDENIKDLITNSINGMIFQEDSDLPSIILNVINNKGLLKILSQNGIETAYKLSDEYFGHRVEALYYKILQANRKFI